MIEYTYEDIIMDPNDPRLEGAIGKECYVSDFPKIALNNARDNLITDRLKRIAKEETCPFVDEEEEDNWAVIILKKEEPKKYVPFENADEFFDAYDSANYSVKNRTVENKLLNYGGIWLKHRESDDFFMVLEIRDDGVVIRRNLFTTSWNDLSNDYTFLDGSPCGNSDQPRR